MGLPIHRTATALVGALRLAGLTVFAQAADDPTDLPLLLRNGGLYVRQFQQSFAQVLSTEHYRQIVRRTAQTRALTRSIESETFFTGVGEPQAWITIRNVLKVDGRPVAGSHDRVMEALAASDRGRTERLRTLATEGARFNIGNVGRTFNDPTLALMFLSVELQPRFTFTLEGSERIGGVSTHRVRFAETTLPSLIRDERDDIDAVISGSFSLARDGRVLRTDLSVAIRSRTTARIRVRYRNEPRVDMLVPDSMEEDYRNDNGAGRAVGLITCAAQYSDYRRFRTSARILP